MPIPFDITAATEPQLAAEIERHNRLYWEEGAPEISDVDYDVLVRRLKELNPNHPLLDLVAAPIVASTGKVRHAKPMLSLDKAYSIDELMEWATKHARSADELFVIQPKYDGISANLVDGVLATRGDGTTGEDVTDKRPVIELEAKNYRGAPDRDARGEIVIRTDDFATLYRTIKKKDGKPYKNSRNAVAGLMGLKDISDMQEQGAKLTLVDYEMISRTVTFAQLRPEWPSILEEVETLPYPMDGLVVKIADEAYRDSLGSTAHHPRGQIAFKFSGIRRQTQLLDIEWSFGKNCLTPNAKLAPVDIGGITIKNATLHNAQLLIDKDIQIGDTVTVERAGDVIPHIVERQPGTERRQGLITACPCCGSDLLRDGPELRCPNADCFETRLQRLLAAIRNIGIEELGEPNLRRLMKSRGVKTLKDIFELSYDDLVGFFQLVFQERSAENLLEKIQEARSAMAGAMIDPALASIDELSETLGKPMLKKMKESGVKTLSDAFALTIEDLTRIIPKGVQEKAAGNLFEKIKVARKPFDYQLLAALNIQGIGPTVAKSILRQFSLQELRALTVDQLSDVDGIGPERATAVTQELAAQSALIDELLTCVEVVQTKGEVVEDGRPTICFTGKMPLPRSHYEEQAKSRGYLPVDTVKSNLSILVAVDVTGKSSKLEKARKSGVTVMNLDDWLATPPPTAAAPSPVKPTAPAPVTPEPPPEPDSPDKQQLTFGF